MVNYKITVITICYNAETIIEKTMRSVLDQTFREMEYLIIDGKSTDKTLSIVQHVADAYPDRVVKIHSEKDKGIYDACNKGISLASGEWVNFMNAGDCFVDTDVLSNIFKESIPDTKSFIYSDNIAIDSDNTIKICHNNRSEGVCLHQSSIYKRELHNKYGYYIVTKPYTVSDLLFFLAIPESEFYKTSHKISINSYGGVSSQGIWCTEKSLGLRVVYGYESVNTAFIKYWKKRIKNIIPYKFRRLIRTQFLKRIKE